MKLKMLKPALGTLDTSTVQTASIPANPTWRTGKNGANARGYNYRWQKASKLFLREHPLCECDDCEAGVKRVLVATVVDHHRPHRGDQVLFWDINNWRAMAKECHDAKTQRENPGGA